MLMKIDILYTSLSRNFEREIQIDFRLPQFCINDVMQGFLGSISDLTFDTYYRERKGMQYIQKV